MIDLRPPPSRPSRLAGLALTLALFGACVAAFAVLQLRARGVETGAGLNAFLAGVGLALLGALCAVAALVAVWSTGVTGAFRALCAIAIAAALAAGPAYVAATGAAAPQINDVSTDLVDPPRFDQARRDRARTDLPTPDAIGVAQAETQRAGYPDLGPLTLALAPDEVAGLALGVVEEHGWRVLGRTAFPRGGPPVGRIQAVARTPVLGFEDDVVIRIRPEGEGSRVDMRSASRIGRSDLGANAARIRAFLADLAVAAGAAP